MIKLYAARFFMGLGVFVFALLLLLIGVTISRHQAVPELPKKMILTLSLREGVAEQASFANPLAMLKNVTPPLNLAAITQTLYKAANDPQVKGLVVFLEPSGIGLAQVQELRDAVLAFKQSNKFAIIYTQNLGGSPAMANYWLATAFNQIWLQPLDELPITGFGMALPFGKNLLDKLGIKAELLYHGTYKGAHETYTRNNISPAQKEEMQRLLAEFNSQFVADVAQARKLTPARVQQLMAQAPLSVEQALVAGLADTMGYEDEFETYMDGLVKNTPPIQLAAYIQGQTTSDNPAKLAVIYADGAITDAPPQAAGLGQGVVSAALVSHALGIAAKDPTIKAIILRIDSPGGTPQASELIHRAIVLAKKKKPVVVSMGNMAASGGYWIAAPATAIVAQPATITGSIGVFGGKVSLQGLWQKLGVNWVSLSGSAQTDTSLFDPHQNYSPKARAKVQVSLDHIYEAFLERVAKGRNLTPQALQNIAQGRVWTGAHAKKLGLVDYVGGLNKAVVVAQSLAKLPPKKPVSLVVLPAAPTPFEQFQQLLEQGLGSGLPTLPDFLSLLLGPQMKFGHIIIK